MLLHFSLGLLLLSGIFFSLLEECNAQVYKTVDEYGNVTYSDSPSAGSEKIAINPVNTQPAITPRPTITAKVTPAPAEKTAIETGLDLKMILPKENTRVLPQDKGLTVVLITRNNLEDGHFFQTMVDGSLHGKKTTANNITIPMPKSLQGKRQIGAAVVNEEGEILEQVAPVEIHVIRP